jgi:hypothetical protein
VIANLIACDRDTPRVVADYDVMVWLWTVRAMS